MADVRSWVRIALVTAGALLAGAASTSCSSEDPSSSPQTGGKGFGGAGGFSSGGSMGGSNNIQCATACGPMQTCVNAACACAAPLKACGQACANTAADGANCGDCGKACPAATPLCSSSACVAMCPTGLMQCGTGCVDAASFQTDPLNCGMCGKACGAGLSCVAGVCGCAANQTSCGGTCVDTKSNNAHCGGCDKPCAGTCQAGTCMAGGGGSGGSGGSGPSDRPANCPAAPELLSDFEEGSGVLVKQGGRDGWWYVFADMRVGMQTPASSTTALPVALLEPAGGECNKYAMHSTAQNHPEYVGFGATLSPGATASAKKPVPLDMYTGITFKIRSGSGNAPPIWFEMLTKETQPADLSGTAMNAQVDMYNTRGRLLEGIGTEWKTFTLPFNTLAPRYLPSGETCAAGIFCEAPPFNAKNALGLQFSLYDQFNASGTYDLWVDDVAMVTGETGVPTYTQTAGGTKPFPRDAAMANGCVKPTGATGKQLIEAFLTWKKTFVVAAGDGLRVVSPEIDNGATVSEGIAYGMLIAVFMNDQPLFDGLLKYWKANSAGGMLMTWKIPGGSGSATDSDEDAAFALIQASKQWGGSYLDDAKKLLTDIMTSDIEAGSVLKPGNQFGGTALTNPSYFAPAYYRLFATVDSANATKWNSVVTSVYQFLNKIEGENGLVPAWCSNGCSDRGGGSYADNNMYQYDSHRTPWRMALDVCWNNNADAKDYVTKITKTFVGKSDAEGLGAIDDIYDGSGNAKTGASKNSMSIIGTAAVGAMATGDASHKAFLDRAYQFLLDASYNTDPTYRDAGYTYYNATVGLLTALTLSGNFNSF